MLTTLVYAVMVTGASAHVAAFADGMFCKNGNDTANPNQNSNIPVDPLYNLPKSLWWMQADRGCNKVPPAKGEILQLPAGGSFGVELATNQGLTTLSFNGDYATEWPDGGQHPEDWHGPPLPQGGYDCLVNNPDGQGGAMHTTEQNTTAGTAFAISYNSNIEDVTMENLAVFSVLKLSPWKRQVTYEVPADLPPCPGGVCYCAWLWVPLGCGQPNMYMQNFLCNVTGSTSTKTIPPAVPPVYCADDSSACVKGPKQMIAWNQAEGNNVSPPSGKTPMYNEQWGFLDGAQLDIFADGPATAPSNGSSTTPATNPSVAPASVSLATTAALAVSSPPVIPPSNTGVKAVSPASAVPPIVQTVTVTAPVAPPIVQTVTVTVAGPAVSVSQCTAPSGDGASAVSPVSLPPAPSLPPVSPPAPISKTLITEITTMTMTTTVKQWTAPHKNHTVTKHESHSFSKLWTTSTRRPSNATSTASQYYSGTLLPSSSFRQPQAGTGNAGSNQPW